MIRQLLSISPLGSYEPPPLTIDALESIFNELWGIIGPSTPNTMMVNQSTVQGIRKQRRRVHQHTVLRRRFSHMTNREFERILIGREP